jgi:hypothetical protein
MCKANRSNYFALSIFAVWQVNISLRDSEMTSIFFLFRIRLYKKFALVECTKFDKTRENVHNVCVNKYNIIGII